MKYPASLRSQLQLWYGILLAAMLLGFAVFAFVFERERRLRGVDEILRARIAEITAAFQSSPERGKDIRVALEERIVPAFQDKFSSESGCYFVVWMRGNAAVAWSVNAPVGIEKPAHGSVSARTRGEFRETLLFTPPVDCILVGCSMQPMKEDLQRLAGVLCAVGCGILFAGLLGGWYLTTRAIRPIDKIREVAEEIAGGNLSQRIVIDRKESELGRLAESLNWTFSRLELEFDKQSHFLADAAHELRTPLAVLLTQTQAALMRERSAKDYRETIVSCERSAQKMRRLIESLFELARLQIGKDTRPLEQCDLALLASDSVEDILPLAEARGIRMITALSAAECVVDRERLNQLLTNLLANAIEYNEEAGEVRVSVGVENGAAVLRIANTGAGIVEEDIPHVFGRFYRADKARVGVGGHIGLGLAIAQAIVLAHGGTIVA
ncbi:MAG: ATP-binding protein, partial [Verrucomicrobiota bacterium]